MTFSWMKPTLLRSRSATKGPKKRQSHNKSTSFTVARGSDAPLFEALCCFSDEIARIDSFEGQRRKKRGKLHLRRWRVTHTPHPSYTVLLGMDGPRFLASIIFWFLLFVLSWGVDDGNGGHQDDSRSGAIIAWSQRRYSGGCHHGHRDRWHHGVYGVRVWTEG